MKLNFMIFILQIIFLTTHIGFLSNSLLCADWVIKLVQLVSIDKVMDKIMFVSQSNNQYTCFSVIFMSVVMPNYGRYSPQITDMLRNSKVITDSITMITKNPYLGR